MSNQSKTVKFTRPSSIFMKFGVSVYDHESISRTNF